MNYNISEILHLPADEQKAIAKAILMNLKEINREDAVSNEMNEELNICFAKTESSYSKNDTVDEIKKILPAKFNHASL